jgi:pimeloyl-ACP methyl ester carboxylesterase
LGLTARQGWTKARLIGHSMGGFLALDMASHDAEPNAARITQLSIISGAYFGVIEVVNQPFRSVKTNPDVAAVYASFKALAALGPLGTSLTGRLADSRLAAPLLSRVIASPDLLLPGVRRNILTNLRPKAFHLAARNGVGYDAEARWRRVSVPTVGIFGALDHLVPPSDAEHLARLLPEAHIEVLSGVGHFALVEKPGAVVRLGII